VNRLDTFNAHRERLFGIAYRMLGSVHDAEDLLQEAYLRWERQPADDIGNPRAFLSTMVTRMSIDHLRSARVRREQYVGDWLPEPLVDQATAPDTLALAESLSTAFLLLLERLNPTERAAFLLRDVFDFSYDEVARTLEKSEANCRQIVRRARERVQTPRPRFAADQDAHQTLLRTFMDATQAGELEPLIAFLTEDAILRSDHGGKAQAARRTLRGARNIGKFFLGISRKFLPDDRSMRFTTLNGRPGAIAYSGARPETAFMADIADGKIQVIYVIRNPDKLRHLPGPESSDHSTCREV
jgi:RNA polymerase sigma-70 factor (ECF subfamily)